MLPTNGKPLREILDLGPWALGLGPGIGFSWVPKCARNLAAHWVVKHRVMQMRYETHILSRKCTITFSRIGTEAPMAAGSFRPTADLALDFALALAIGFVFFLGRFCALGGPSGYPPP